MSIPEERIASCGLSLLAVSIACAPTPEINMAESSFKYPVARRSDVTDNYHGTEVADPYRWLEDPDSTETRAWITAENAITASFLKGAAARPRIKARLTEVWDFERYGVPYKRGRRYFFRKNDGLQNQSVLYTVRRLDDEPKVLLDPNKLSQDGTVALQSYAVSNDGRHLAYSTASGGSDWVEWKVRNIESGKDLDDRIEWSKFSGASWSHDGSGFYYSAYDAPQQGDELEAANYYQKLYFHRLGTPQSKDELVYHRPDQRTWGFDGHVTDDGRYLIIRIWKGTDDLSMILYRDLSKISEVISLIDTFDHAYEFIDNDGPLFWFRTERDAPRGRVIAIDTRQPSPDKWRQIIPQTDATLLSVDIIDDKFLALYLVDAKSAVKVFDLDGKFIRDVKMPGPGTVGSSGARRHDKETFYSFTSFTAPSTIYRYDVAKDVSTVFRKPAIAMDLDALQTKQVFYQSIDGTRVPMFITHRKDIEPNANTPTYLYGYGGFDISLTPYFSISQAVWMEMGGIFAVANIRGGGEYGEAWHDAGKKLNKQNVFDDFIAAAEWLIDNGYTSAPKLAIGGRSNGGLLVGACIIQRPELFGAAMPGVGVMDMLRFHKFTIGWAWVDDYGSSGDAEQFAALHAYSPLHNVTRGTAYPPTFITTADHDDRVVPGHSFKFAAAMQWAQGGPAPILIRIETKAGHGAGKPTEKIIDEVADSFAFLTRAFEM